MKPPLIYQTEAIDIPTRKRIITCASSDMQQPINGMED